MLSLSPITDKLYHALVKIDVAKETVEASKNNYTYGILNLYENSLKIQEMLETSGSVESFNLEYEENYVQFMLDVYDKNKDNAVIVDTGINDLDNVTILRILNKLDYRDKLLFIDIVRNSTSNRFIARNQNVLALLTRLSTRELLYVTFHFLTKPITICGSTNLQFPIFFTNLSDVDLYIELAEKNNLSIRDMVIKY